MGGAIHKSEGFYFRHDSVRNPPFEDQMTKKTKNEEAYRRNKVDKDSSMDLLRKIVKKFE